MLANLKHKIKIVGKYDSLKIDTIVHALTDIEESFKKNYKAIIPNILNQDIEIEEIQDLLWDVREEFRHIEYHIRDADLLNL